MCYSAYAKRQPRHSNHAKFAVGLLRATATFGWFLAAAAQAANFADEILEIRVNSQTAAHSMIVLRDDQGGLWLTEDEFAELRIRVPNVASQTRDGHRYFPIAAIAGSHIVVHDAAQSADISIPGGAFLSTELHAQQALPPVVTRSSWGTFLNYDVNGQHSADEYFGDAFTEIGIFSPYGVATNTTVGTYTSSDRRAVRLETALQRDFANSLHTLKIGDAISNPGTWDNALRFGGVQWGTNYSIRPDLITTPLLSASGQAAVPSTVDVYINNQQISSQQVAPGPFVIDRLPSITGAGDIRVVVRDLLGREQVITTSFYSSANLLQAGLKQYSVELGALRNNYGIYSNEYGRLMASGTYRQGVTDWFTLEGHATGVNGNGQTAGLNAAVRVGSLGSVSTTIAHGGDAQGSGWLTGVAIQHAGQRFSVNATAEFAGDGFRKASATSVSQFRSRVFAQAGANLGRAGTVSAAYGIQRFPDQVDQEVASLTYSISIRDLGFFSLVLSRSHADHAANSALLLFTMPLSGMRSVSATARYDDQLSPATRELEAAMQKSPPLGPGYGYRFGASTSGNYDAQWLNQFEAMAVEMEAAKFANLAAQRVDVSGGAIWMDSHWYASREVNDSFALVEVPGVSNLTIYAENQPVAHTDHDGRALIRNLRAYEQNKISIDPTELPLDTALSSDSIEVTPAYRSGSVVQFPARRVRAATLTLVTENGTPVPSGAQVSLKDAQFPVGMNGFVYVTGADHSFIGKVSWTGGQCSFRLPVPPEDDPLPDLGKVQCRSRAPSQPQ